MPDKNISSSTTKHHDGFALFPTRFSNFNLRDCTGFKRDPLAELAAACRKNGIRLGFYYSQGQDWTNPGGGLSAPRRARGMPHKREISTLISTASPSSDP